MEQIKGLGLEVPDAETDLSSLQTKKSSEQVEAEKLKEAQQKAEEHMFSSSGNNSDIEVSPLDYENAESSSESTREQIVKDTVRTVFVTEEKSLKYPCVIIDLTNAKNMSMSLLRQIKTIVYSRDDIHKACGDDLDAVNKMIDDLETSVYTKYGNKVVNIGFINKNDKLRLMIQLLIQANIGEMDKDFSVLYAEKKDEFRSMNIRNSCDFILL